MSTVHKLGASVLACWALGASAAVDGDEFPGPGQCYGGFAANIRTTPEQQRFLQDSRGFGVVVFPLTPFQRERYLALCPEIGEAPQAVRVFPPNQDDAACGVPDRAAIPKAGWLRLMSPCPAPGAGGGEPGPGFAPF